MLNFMEDNDILCPPGKVRIDGDRRAAAVPGDQAL